jgi:hypothetical protein
MDHELSIFLDHNDDNLPMLEGVRSLTSYGLELQLVQDPDCLSYLSCPLPTLFTRSSARF